jgi:hypothetical protein
MLREVMSHWQMRRIWIGFWKRRRNSKGRKKQRCKRPTLQGQDREAARIVRVRLYRRMGISNCTILLVHPSREEEEAKEEFIRVIEVVM